MRYLSAHENKPRGTFDFPIELYYVDTAHPRYQMPFHWHIESEFILVLKGKFHLSLEGQPITLQAGQSAFLPAGSIHGGWPEDCIYECLVLDLDRFFQDNIICRERFHAVFGEDVQIAPFFEAGSEGGKLIDAIFTAMETEQRGYEFTATGLLWQFIGLVLNQTLYAHPSAVQRQYAKQAEKIKKSLRLIRKDFDKQITLEQLANEAGFVPRYFCRIFRQIIGRTPIDYLNYYRVECAAELLCSSDESVTEIALSCGFEDLSYFIRLFKKYKGVSAKAYQRQQNLSVGIGGF